MTKKWEDDVEAVAKTSFMVWELAKNTEQKVEAGKSACQLILGLLAKQRTQLLARVREEVIGEFREETDGYINRDYLITETTIENNLIKEQLEKLRELADD